MDFESNQINKTINKELDRYADMYRDNGKLLIPLDYNFAGTILPIPLTDNFIIEELLKDTVNKDVRMEALQSIINGLSTKEKLVLRIFIECNINKDEFTEFDKMEYHNKVLKNVNN